MIITKQVQKRLIEDIKQQAEYCNKIASRELKDLDKQAFYHIASQSAQLVATVNQLLGTMD